MNEWTLNSISVTINETTINYSGLVQKMNDNTIINTEYTWDGGLSYSEMYGILAGIENGTYTYVGKYYIGG